MNVNIFLILMLVLIGIVGIVMSLLFTSKTQKIWIWQLLYHLVF